VSESDSEFEQNRAKILARFFPSFLSLLYPNSLRLPRVQSYSLLEWISQKEDSLVPLVLNRKHLLRTLALVAQAVLSLASRDLIPLLLQLLLDP